MSWAYELSSAGVGTGEYMLIEPSCTPTRYTPTSRMVEPRTVEATDCGIMEGRTVAETSCTPTRCAPTSGNPPNHTPTSEQQAADGSAAKEFGLWYNARSVLDSAAARVSAQGDGSAA